MTYVDKVMWVICMVLVGGLVIACIYGFAIKNNAERSCASVCDNRRVVSCVSSRMVVCAESDGGATLVVSP